MKRAITGLFLLCLTMPAVAGNTVTVKLITADIAQRIVNAALQHCSETGYQVTAVVVARDGRIQALLRHALASPVTLKIAKKKAKTSANMRLPSADLSKTLAQTSRKLTRMRGGLPIEAGGQFYGGVGVSGATGEIDEACAQAGLDAVADDLEFEE
ncbi:MAG: heme-binding protein [Gammaproteobacteria bacterium]|nr:heme-binding protein [Gammaproteobacteria bacterium]